MSKYKVTMTATVEADNEDDAIMDASTKAGYGDGSVDYKAEKLEG